MYTLRIIQLFLEKLQLGSSSGKLQIATSKVVCNIAFGIRAQLGLHNCRVALMMYQALNQIQYISFENKYSDFFSPHPPPCFCLSKRKLHIQEAWFCKLCNKLFNGCIFVLGLSGYVIIRSKFGRNFQTLEVQNKNTQAIIPYEVKQVSLGWTQRSSCSNRSFYFHSGSPLKFLQIPPSHFCCPCAIYHSLLDTPPSRQKWEQMNSFCSINGSFFWLD